MPVTDLCDCTCMHEWFFRTFEGYTNGDCTGETTYCSLVATDEFHICLVAGPLVFNCLMR